MNVSRDDFVIAIRSAFLKKQTKQKFSLLSLIILSILILFLSNIDSKITNLARSGINEFIYRGSFVISAPEKIFKNLSGEIKNHFGLYSSSKLTEEELNKFKSKKISLDILQFENKKLREQLDDYLISTEVIYSKIIIDNKSPYLRSFVINKGSRDGIKTGRHGATILGGGKMGILLGMKSKVVMHSSQIAESITEASGLDFASCGPEVAYLHDIGRIKFLSSTDLQAKKTFLMCSKKLGILPAIEACYVIHSALKEIKKRKNPRENHLIHLCGSGESNVTRMLKFKRENE